MRTNLNLRPLLLAVLLAFAVAASACSSASVDPAPQDVAAPEPTALPAAAPTAVPEPTAAPTAEPEPTAVAEPTTVPAQDLPDTGLAWFSADREGVFVAGLSAERIESETGIEVGTVERKTGDALVGPTISFAGGDVLVQINVSTFTFDEVVASLPQASLETMSGYGALVIGGSSAVIDFPEGPVTVTSFDFSQPDSGVELARLIAEARADF